MTAGKVYDITTGRLIGNTASLSRTFLYQILGLQRSDVLFYVVFGPSRSREQRRLINSLRDMDVELLYDGSCPEQCLIVEGTKNEWEALVGKRNDT